MKTNNHIPNSKNCSKLLNDIIYRGLYDNCNNIEEFNSFSKTPDKLTFYIGIDLTAPSLHVGHLATLMLLRRIMKMGHKCLIVLGGGTTYIGDPSGKNKMRKMLSSKQIKQNMSQICNDIFNIFLPDENPFTDEKFSINHNNELIYKSKQKNFVVLNNFYWLKNLNYIDLLRDIGRHFTINKMIKMDSMSSRLECAESLSFIEFNYPILQAYDFYYLNKNFNCNCEIGGSDQWGNMLRGVELVEKMNHNKTFALTIPLLTTANGKKMGKSEDGAIWLNPNLLDSTQYSQYFRNVTDEDVERHLKLFTDLSENQINDILKEEKNAQKQILAYLATAICRNEQSAFDALIFGVDLFSKNNAKDGPSPVNISMCTQGNLNKAKLKYIEKDSKTHFKKVSLVIRDKTENEIKNLLETDLCININIKSEQIESKKLISIKFKNAKIKTINPPIFNHNTEEAKSYLTFPNFESSEKTKQIKCFQWEDSCQDIKQLNEVLDKVNSGEFISDENKSNQTNNHPYLTIKIPESETMNDQNIAIISDLSISRSLLTIHNGTNLIELMRKLNFAQSNSEARRLITSGGVKVNNNPITDINWKFEIEAIQSMDKANINNKSDAISVLLVVGKKKRSKLEIIRKKSSKE